MINLRYHIVSITAVFLALGIGLAFGASFINGATVDVLEQNLTDIEGQNRDLGADNDRLQRLVQDDRNLEQALREQGLPQLVAGRLEAVAVLIVAVRGVDEDVVDRARDAVAAAGADLGGVLWLTDRLALDDDAEVEDLRGALGNSVTDPELLRATFVRRVGNILAEAARPTPPAPPAPDPATTTTAAADPGGGPTTPAVDPATTTTAVGPVPVPGLLASLLASGFLELDAPEAPPAGFALVPATGLRVLVVSGAGARLDAATVTIPLLERLLGEPDDTTVPAVVAAEATPAPAEDATAPAPPSLVALLRDDPAVRDRISTVDDLDRFAGLVAAVLALDAAGAGQRGHYGLGAGAQRLLPASLPATPGG